MMNELFINKNIDTPIYSQLEKYFREKINSGEFKENDKLPSEKELCSKYSISRMTVRRVMDNLSREGLVVGFKGKGTFVNKPNVVRRDLSFLSSIIDDMQKDGLPITIKVLERNIINPTKDIAEKLNLNLSEKIIQIKRLKLNDSDPFFIEHSFLPLKYCPNFLNKDLKKFSIFHILESDYNYLLNTASISIEAINADNSISNLLKIKEGSSLLKLKQTTYLKNNKTIEFMIAYTKTDKLKYFVSRSRRI